MNIKSETLHKLRYKLLIIYLLMAIVFSVLSVISSEKYDFKFQTIVDATQEFSKIQDGDSRILLYRQMDCYEPGITISFFTRDIFVDAFVMNDVPRTTEIPDGVTPSYSWGKSSIISKSPGQFRHFITLDETSCESEYLCILLTKTEGCITNFDVKLHEGVRGDIALLFTSYEFLDIVMTVLMLLFGLAITIIYFVQRSSLIDNKYNFYIGILSIETALWSAMQLTPIHLMMDSSIAQQYIYYISLFSLPIFILLYFENFVSIACTLEEFAVIISSILFVSLNAIGIVQFSVTSRLYLCLCFIVMLSILYKTYKSKTFKTRSKLLIATFYFFIICVAINVSFYMFVMPVQPSISLAKFGLVAYISVVLYNSIEGFISSMIRAQEGNKMFDIAYTDNLTRVGNRYAFDRDINTLNIDYVCLVSCDVNNLKYYNDTFGHAQGDELLKKSVELLQSVYGNTVYRTGGDEFIVLLAMSSDEELKYKYDCLSKAMKKHNDKNGATLLVEIATGYSKYQEGDESYEDILRRADKNMYRDKKALKSVSPIKYER